MCEERKKAWESHLARKKRICDYICIDFPLSQTRTLLPGEHMNSRSRHSNDLSLPLPEYHQQYNSSPLPPITSPPLLPPSQNLWGPSIHRTSNSRDEIHPQVTHHQPPLLPRLDHHPQIKREQRDSLPYHNQQPVPPTMEDSMPSTSDFVKKLYKCARCQSSCLLYADGLLVECSRTNLSRMSCPGARTAIVSSSKI